MGIPVTNVVAIPQYLVLVTKFKGMGDCNEMTGTHSVITLYAGNDETSAIGIFSSHKLERGESVSFIRLDHVVWAKHYKERHDGKENT